MTELTYEPLADDGVTALSAAEQALAQATTPAQSAEVEAAASAGMAYAAEKRDYELTLTAAMLYIRARRKTTALILPRTRSKGALRGTLDEFGLTKKQWRLRKAEAEVPEAVLDEYADDCILSSATPTPTGLVAFAAGPSGTPPKADFLTIRKRLLNAALKWLDTADTDERRSVTLAVIKHLELAR